MSLMMKISLKKTPSILRDPVSRDEASVVQVKVFLFEGDRWVWVTLHIMTLRRLANIESA